MFTGLVEGVGSLRAREMRGGDARLRVDAGSLPWGAQAGVVPGESIAVNGVCLTVVAFDDAGFEADASNETLAATTLGTLDTGRPLNLERALRADARLGGHLVSGHVDGVGRVLAVAPDARAQRWRFAAPRRLMRYLAAKGSICVDGVSLTVNAVEDAADDAGQGDGAFELALVPHTIAHTAFAHTRIGDPVNLEVDLVARYTERLLAARET
jgi:riboflavin synthase